MFIGLLVPNGTMHTDYSLERAKRHDLGSREPIRFVRSGPLDSEGARQQAGAGRKPDQVLVAAVNCRHRH